MTAHSGWSNWTWAQLQLVNATWIASLIITDLIYDFISVTKSFATFLLNFQGGGWSEVPCRPDWGCRHSVTVWLLKQLHMQQVIVLLQRFPCASVKCFLLGGIFGMKSFFFLFIINLRMGWCLSFPGSVPPRLPRREDGAKRLQRGRLFVVCGRPWSNTRILGPVSGSWHRKEQQMSYLDRNQGLERFWPPWFKAQKVSTCLVSIFIQFKQRWLTPAAIFVFVRGLNILLAPPRLLKFQLYVLCCIMNGCLCIPDSREEMLSLN